MNRKMSHVSVIIPALNEAPLIEKTLRDVQAQDPFEVILADGHSTDRTEEIARHLGGVVLAPQERGRARQMNAGASVARGDVLLFLHADTSLPAGGLQLISDTLNLEHKVVGGRFRVSFDDSALRYRILASYTRFSFFSYGDQGFFVRKREFEAMGGFDAKTPFEDVDFFRRLKKRGPVRILKESVQTSARRFQKTGFMKQKAVNLGLSLMASMGISPKGLMKRWYPNIR